MKPQVRPVPAPAALQRSDEQFRLLVQAVTDYAIFMLDASGRVANWNAGAQRIKGYLPSEIIGEHFSRFYTEEDRERGEPQRSLETATTRGSYVHEGWRVRKDGTRFWASVVIDPVRDASGEIIGFAKVTRDITERRNAQEALERTQAALMQSQKMDAIGQLTGGIAHDFNNLLMAVLGSLELLKKRVGADPRNRLLVDNAIRGAQRGAALTQRMLAFARRQNLRLQALDLNTVVSGMLDMLNSALGPAIDIVVDLPKSLPAVRADRNQFELALLNLALNARDAMPEGGTLKISAHEATVADDDVEKQIAGGDYVRVAIVDTGVGMDEATLAGAMEPFFTTKGVGKGTGLGLSMVHGLAEQTGGQLRLKSTPGKGTTAELWLPIAQTQGESFPNEDDDREVARSSRALSILVVDDDELVLINSVAMIEDLGHRVVAAPSAQKALEALESDGAIDVVLTDYAMPQMNGLELAEAIRRDYPRVAIVVATGFAEMPKAAGSRWLKLDKPFDQAQLEAVLRRAVRV